MRNSDEPFWQRIHENLKEAAEINKRTDFFLKHGIHLSKPNDCANELANHVIIERAQKETISANDIKYSVRHGKRYKYNARKIVMDNDHYLFIFGGRFTENN